MQNAPITGDSFVRVLLNVAPLQNEVAKLLLERLPEFCDSTSEEDKVVPQLILGQFRWWVPGLSSKRLIAALCSGQCSVLQCMYAWYMQ